MLATLTGASLPDPLGDEPAKPAGDTGKADGAPTAAVPTGGATKASGSEQAEKAEAGKPVAASDDKGTPEGKPAADAAKATAEPTQTITPEKSSAAKR
jgi:hypothetical protein